MATAFRWETKIQFDAGMAVWPSRPKHLFLTHTHADHVQCLCQELIRGGSSLCRVYFPAAEERKIVAHLQAFQTLVRDDNDDEATSLEAYFNIELKPVAKGSELRIERDVIVRVVEGTHRKVCNGYSLLREKKNLKTEYIGIDGAELGALRKQGVEISQVALEPLFCFLGDTRPDVFHHHPELLQTHHTVMMECTFCDDPARAVETGHTDWSELEPIMAANPQVLFVLQHFSVRYGDRFWEQQLKNYNQKMDAATANNAHLMLPGLECLCFQCQPKKEVTSA
jgi:ribonuclease Z